MLNTKHCTRIQDVPVLHSKQFFLSMFLNCFYGEKSLPFKIIHYTGWEYPVHFECQKMFSTEKGKYIERPRMMENGKVEFAFFLYFSSVRLSSWNKPWFHSGFPIILRITYYYILLFLPYFASSGQHLIITYNIIV